MYTVVAGDEELAWHLWNDQKKKKKTSPHPEFIIWRRLFPSGNAAVVFVAAESFIIWLGESSRHRLSGGRRFHSDTYRISINYLKVRQFFFFLPLRRMCHWRFLVLSRQQPLIATNVISSIAAAKADLETYFVLAFFPWLTGHVFNLSSSHLNLNLHWFCVIKSVKKKCISHQMSFSFILKKDNLIRRHPTREKSASAAFKSVSLINE